MQYDAITVVGRAYTLLEAYTQINMYTTTFDAITSSRKYPKIDLLTVYSHRLHVIMAITVLHHEDSSHEMV
jgi:hypothetical protein